MIYAITGLDLAPFAPLFGLSDAGLAARGAVRMIADNSGYPCRTTLDEAVVGEALLVVGHVSHDAATPFRASGAIFIGERGASPAHYVDRVPPALDRRILSLRAFDAAGMMIDAALADLGVADPVIRRLLDDPAVDHLDAHYATRGCFAGRIERHGD